MSFDHVNSANGTLLEYSSESKIELNRNLVTNDAFLVTNDAFLVTHDAFLVMHDAFFTGNEYSYSRRVY
jgi:hypothetical protein